METDTGKVWRVHRTTGERTFLAQGPPGLDNLVIAPDGTIYVSNFVQGNVWKVNEAVGVLESLLPDRSLAFPFSLGEAPDGSLIVGDFSAVARVRGGEIQRMGRLLTSDLQLLTPGAAQIGGDVYYSDFLPPDGRIFRLNLASGKRDEVAGGFGFPWTVREGPAGHLLVVDQMLGVVFDVDPATGLRIPLVQGLRSPSGLAFDRARDMVYVSDTGGGRILAVGISLGQPTVVADGLDGPEGIALHRDGSLLVVEGDAGRLVLIEPAGGRRQLIATGLPTRTAGIGLPLLNYSSDVLVRSDGSIVVTGPSSGSLIELTR